jgi:hypothetical protein
MGEKKASKLEREPEKVIVEDFCCLGLRIFPLLPAHHTMKEMARVSVAVYEAAVDSPKDHP